MATLHDIFQAGHALGFEAGHRATLQANEHATQVLFRSILNLLDDPRSAGRERDIIRVLLSGEDVGHVLAEFDGPDLPNTPSSAEPEAATAGSEPNG